MNVKQAIEGIRSKSLSKKPSSICCIPNIVQAPRVGKEYTYTCGFSSTPPEHIAEAECMNHYIEEGILICIFRNSDTIQLLIEHSVSY